MPLARRCVVIVAVQRLSIIPCCQRSRPFDGVSEARTEFVRDVSDGSRPVYRRLLFWLVSYRPLALGRRRRAEIGAPVSQDSLSLDTLLRQPLETCGTRGWTP